MSVRSWFSVAAHQQQYENEGYIIVDFFTPEELQAISDFYDRTRRSAGLSGFHSTLHNTDADYRTNVRERVSQLALPHLHRLMNNFRIITCSFVVKEPDANSAVVIHQDWSLTDEHHFPALNIWLPVTPITAENGPLHILPGSHKLPFTYRGTGLPDPCASIHDIPLNRFLPVYLKPGQAIIYDVRMIHASPPNRSDRPRVACAIGALPDEAEMLHFRYRPEEGQVYTYGVDEKLFIDYAPTDAFFASQQMKGKTAIPADQLRPFTVQQITPLLRSRGWMARVRDFLKS